MIKIKKISYNILEDGTIFATDDEISGKYKTEISNALFNKIFNKNAVPLKLNDNNKIVEDVELAKIFKRIDELAINLKNTEYVIIKAMDYFLDNKEIPSDLQAILDQRKEWQKEMDDLNE